MSGTSGFEFLADPVRVILDEMGIRNATPPQLEASPIIARGENVLIIAPTGSGKTEAAMLPLLSRLMKKGHGDGISIIYITPLRALNRDMLRRLELWCSKLSLKIDVRHGDTPLAQRQRQSRNPPDLLVTTPETLQAILPGSRMRQNLATVQAVVVDELHNLVESKRGVQLTVGLERLRKVAGDFQLVALSATVGSPEETARFIFGNAEHRIVRAVVAKEFRYRVEYPTPDSNDSEISRETFSTIDLAARLSLIDEQIGAHKSTLIFVNSRTLAEMLGEKLSRLRGDVGVHHGSLPREERERVENAFKSGQLRALVCTSTLELGIDIGSVDLVLQYMSPRQVTSLIQRVGRSGHDLRRTSEGVLITVSADDILESAASIEEAQKGRLEETRPYQNSLDVLAHQIAGYLMDYDSLEKGLILAEVRRAYPYRDLSEETFQRVVDYLGQLRKLRADGTKLMKTRGTREYYFQNLSTIPDEMRYFVVDVANNQTVGILGMEFVLLHAKVGLHFILKGRIWQIEKIANDRKIYVTSVEDPLAAVPGWDGEMLPIPQGLAQKTGQLRKRVASVLSENAPEVSAQLLASELPVAIEGTRMVVDEIHEHLRLGAPLPGDDLILLEGWQKYLIIHSCFGEKLNKTLAYTFEEVLSRKGLIRLWYLDGYRILIELTVDSSEVDLKGLAAQLYGMDPDEFERTYAVAAQRNFPFPGRVKAIAERFGALKRGQFIAHPNLCSLPTRFENTPIFEEALQETGRDLLDMRRAKELLVSVAQGKVRVETFLSDEKPTPIAYHILYRYLDVPELVAPDSLAKTTIEKMKLSIYGTSIELVCMKCGRAQGFTTIGELADEPHCASCRSGLLSPAFWTASQVTKLMSRKLSHDALSDDEKSELAKSRRAADLVLSYGRKAIIAQAVYGIGPQTAGRILAKMDEDEESFYRELLEAKLKFIETRPFW
ncbi:MAG: DEAD/DEAH box helicase [Thaumarchaeota archaeon]|nr:DEAD/DEAH box helicase [Nitrososphaerota archaeon]